MRHRRIAIPLTQYLTTGTYDASTSSAMESMCQLRITPRYPNFNFFLADVHNGCTTPRPQSRVGIHVSLRRRNLRFRVSHLGLHPHAARGRERYTQEIGGAEAGGRCLCTAYVISRSPPAAGARGSVKAFRPCARGC